MDTDCNERIDCYNRTDGEKKVAARHDLREAYMTTRRNAQTPPKYDVFGVYVSKTNYDDALESVMAAAKAGIP